MSLIKFAYNCDNSCNDCLWFGKSIYHLFLMTVIFSRWSCELWHNLDTVCDFGLRYIYRPKTSLAFQKDIGAWLGILPVPSTKFVFFVECMYGLLLHFCYLCDNNGIDQVRVSHECPLCCWIRLWGLTVFGRVPTSRYFAVFCAVSIISRWHLFWFALFRLVPFYP